VWAAYEAGHQPSWTSRAITHATLPTAATGGASASAVPAATAATALSVSLVLRRRPAAGGA
jgi:hypothetical protein